MKNTGDQKTTKVNINIFLSQDIIDDGASDGECASGGGISNLLGSSKCREVSKINCNSHNFHVWLSLEHCNNLQTFFSLVKSLFGSLG